MALAEGLPGTSPPAEEEPPLLLSLVPPTALQAQPSLARLLRGLSDLLGPDGLSPPRRHELQQAEAGLSLQRQAWLQPKILWERLQDLLRDPQDLDPPVLQALERSLAVAQLRRTSPAFASLLPPPQDPSGPRARLLPALESRLARAAREVAAYHGAPPPTPPGRVAGLLAEERDRLNRARRRRLLLARLLRGQRRHYPQVLARCRAALERLGGERGAGRQAELDGGRGRYLEAKGVALLLKSRLEEVALLKDTYPPATLEAHRRLRAGLEAERRRAGAREAELRGRLAALEALGPEFRQRAERYRRLREALGQRQWLLRQLREHGPAAPDPATSDPATSDTVTSDSATSDTVTSDPATFDPAASNLVTSDPMTSDLVTSGLMTSDLMTSEVTYDPVTLLPHDY